MGMIYWDGHPSSTKEQKRKRKRRRRRRRMFQYHYQHQHQQNFVGAVSVVTGLSSTIRWHRKREVMTHPLTSFIHFSDKQQVAIMLSMSCYSSRDPGKREKNR